MLGDLVLCAPHPDHAMCFGDELGLMWLHGVHEQLSYVYACSLQPRGRRCGRGWLIRVLLVAVLHVRRLRPVCSWREGYGFVTCDYGYGFTNNRHISVPI